MKNPIELVNKQRHLTYNEKKQAAHIKAVQMTNEENSRFSPILQASKRASFEKVAQTLGLDGVDDDIFSFVSCDTPSARLPLLVTCEDLCEFLRHEHQKANSIAMRTFFNVTQDSPLYKLIHSIDLTMGLNIYRDSHKPNIFLNSLKHVKEFKAHVIQTIYAYNQSIKQPLGIPLLLTKKHLMKAYGSNYCGYEILPEYLHEHEKHEQTLRNISSTYYQEVKELEEQFARENLELTNQQIHASHHFQSLIKPIVPMVHSCAIIRPIVTPLSVQNLPEELSPAPTEIEKTEPQGPTIQSPPFKSLFFSTQHHDAEDQEIISKMLNLSVTEIQTTFFANSAHSSKIVRTEELNNMLDLS